MDADQIQSGIAEIRELAAKVAELLAPVRGGEMGYDRASLEWVEGFLERQRPEHAAPPAGLLNALGAYLGECVVAATDGEWAWIDERWGVRFPSGSAAFPFSKVWKQFENGPSDGMLGFYDVAVDYVAAGRLDQK